MSRLPTGVRGFDEIVGGGLMPGRVYIVTGPPGAGKTTFSVQFIVNGALMGENGLYLSLSEPVSNIIEDMTNSYKFPIKDLISRNKLFFVDLAPYEENVICGDEKVKSYIEKFLTAYTHKIESAEHYFTLTDVYHFLSKILPPLKIKRLVIDSVMGLRGISPETYGKEFIKFMRGLKTFNVTTLIISEMYETLKYQPEHFMAHGLIVFHHFLHEGRMVRGVQVLKMRGTRHSEDIFEVVFTSSGLEVTKRVIQI